MANKLLASAVAIAAAVLLALGVGYALGAFDSGTSGPPGSVSNECSKYAYDQARSAGVRDPFIKGIVSIGLKEGPNSTAAAALLRAIGTTYYMPLPYHQAAFVCVKPGYESDWIDRMKAMDWVEWAHAEGVHPLLTLPN